MGADLGAVGGLIPARAGKTSGAVVAAIIFNGSSPRGRGKLRSPLRSKTIVRLIPARAGKTRAQFSGHALGKAHPRAGGENQAPDARVPGA